MGGMTLGDAKRVGLFRTPNKNLFHRQDAKFAK